MHERRSPRGQRGRWTPRLLGHHQWCAAASTGQGITSLETPSRCCVFYLSSSKDVDLQRHQPFSLSQISPLVIRIMRRLKCCCSWHSTKLVTVLPAGAGDGWSTTSYWQRQCLDGQAELSHHSTLPWKNPPWELTNTVLPSNLWIPQ